MKATVVRLLIFIPYALAVWVTAYRGLRGDDGLGLICILLLFGGAGVLAYIKFLQRRVTLELFSPAVVVVLGLAGLALGTMSSGEADIGIIAGLTIAGGAVIVIAVMAQRRKRRLRTLFISYRRADSGEITRLIHRRLAKRFGDENIFFDIDSIALGSSFREVIADAVNHSDALIAVIGDKWVDIAGKDGRRRIDDKDDLVRIEIETAINNSKVLVVPLATNGADIPEADRLPQSIKDLALRNGGVVRPPPDFDSDMSRLIQGLEKGAIAPWSRAAKISISWGWVMVMVVILLAPVSFWLVEEMTGDYRNMNSAALSPDQSMLASAHGSGIGVKSQIRIWDALNGSNLLTIRLDHGPVWEVEWSPDGAYLAFGNHDGGLVILETRTWQVKFRFQQHSGMLQEIAWSHKGNRIATGDQHGALRVWDLPSGELAYTVRPHSGNIENLRWSPDDQYIATASWDRTAAISDSKSGGVVYRFEGFTSYVTNVAWSLDGEAIAASSLEKPYLMMWKLEDANFPVSLIGHKSKVDKIEWSPVSKMLASGSADNTVRVWNDTGALKHVFDVKGSGSPDLAWSKDGSLLAATDDRSIRIWNISTGQLLHEFPAHDDEYDIEILGWSSDNIKLVTRGSSDDTVKTWDIFVGRTLAEFHVGLVQDWF